MDCDWLICYRKAGGGAGQYEQWTEYGWVAMDCDWPVPAGLEWSQDECRCVWGERRLLPTYNMNSKQNEMRFWGLLSGQLQRSYPDPATSGRTDIRTWHLLVVEHAAYNQEVPGWNPRPARCSRESGVWI